MIGALHTVDTQQILFLFCKFLLPPCLFSECFPAAIRAFIETAIRLSVIEAINSISLPGSLLIPPSATPTTVRYPMGDGRVLWTAQRGNRCLVLAGTFWKPDLPPLFTTQTDQLEKLQAGGELKCLEAGQRRAMVNEPSLAGWAEM